jgi:hypothetical protein
MAEIHKLFEQGPNEEEAPEYEEIGVINVARLVGTRMIPDTKAYRPDELPDLDAAARLFGSGDFRFIGRRLQVGPDGQPAGSIWRKRDHTIGAEHGPWLRMLDKPPAAPPNGQAPTNGAPANGAAFAAGAQVMGSAGMPPMDPNMFSNPFVLMMWMGHQQAERDREARKEQIERDRIAAERHEAEARRQHEMTLAMIQNQTKGDGGALAGVPQMFGQFAEILGKVHAPPPPPPVVAAPAAPAPTLKQQLEDAVALKDFAKKLGGDDDIELVKAIGQGLGSLGGIGNLFGGLTGAAAPGGG